MPTAQTIEIRRRPVAQPGVEWRGLLPLPSAHARRRCIAAGEIGKRRHIAPSFFELRHPEDDADEKRPVICFLSAWFIDGSFFSPVFISPSACRPAHIGHGGDRGGVTGVYQNPGTGRREAVDCAGDGPGHSERRFPGVLKDGRRR